MPATHTEIRPDLQQHQLLPIEQVAALVGCSQRTVRRLEAAGNGFPRRVPLTGVRRARVLYPRTDILAFIEAKKRLS